MPKDSNDPQRIELMVCAFMTTASIKEVVEKTHISRSKVNQLMKTPEFQERLAEARQEALSQAISYMQGSTMECAQTLMEIVRNEENSPQVRINAIDTIFRNCKVLGGDTIAAGVAVKIIDSL